MVALDIARIVVALVGFVVGAYQVVLIRAAPTSGQRWRLAGIAGALGVLCASRVENVGQPLSWQFVGTSLVVIALLVGSYKFRNETPAQPRRRPGPFGPVNPHRRQR